MVSIVGTNNNLPQLRNIMNHDNSDQPEIYKNPLIECIITISWSILKSRNKSYKLIKLLRYFITIIVFSQVILN